jgi:zinc-binding alcohol dehydrogenase/oxidoreductase
MHKIKPVIDSIYPMEDFKEAFARMEDSKQFGKIVLDLR